VDGLKPVETIRNLVSKWTMVSIERVSRVKTIQLDTIIRTTKKTKFMKTSSLRFTLASIAAAIGFATSAQGQLIINTAAAAGQPSYDFGTVSISAYFGDTAAVPNALINSNNLNFFGVNSQLTLAGDNNVNAINDRDGILGGADQERLQLVLDSGYGLSGITWNFSRADGPLATDGVSISGFAFNPGATFSGGISGTPTFSGGVLNFQISTFNGTVNTITFANPAASYGATLEIIVADSTQSGAQFASRTFTVVPEPSSMALIALGVGAMVAARKRNA
jgi:hypothetical protein